MKYLTYYDKCFKNFCIYFQYKRALMFFKKSKHKNKRKKFMQTLQRKKSKYCGMTKCEYDEFVTKMANQGCSAIVL